MATAPVYQASPIKRKRRTKAAIESLKSALYDIVAADHPMTVRQIFYQASKLNLVEKTEAAYNNGIVRLLTQMRLEGSLPFGWITDNTRWQRKPETYSSLQSALDRTTECYRRSVWDSQSVYIEIWLEKDALAGVVYEVTDTWDVPLMVTRGYPSMSFTYSAAETIAAENKPTYLYYFGDYDPSGVDISRNLEARLREFAPDAEIHFERVALNAEQIEIMDLPTRPTKKTDSRSKGFIGRSVELDAVPPGILREMVEDCITRHIDKREYKTLQTAEESERKVLEMFSTLNRTQELGCRFDMDLVTAAKVTRIVAAAERNPEYEDLCTRLGNSEKIDAVYREFLKRRKAAQ
jgi:hypothetical protein